MKGWKTWVGIALLTAGGVLSTLEKTGIIPPGMGTGISELLYTIGTAFGLVGIGSKIEKGSR
jgi:hypothetical protein